MGSEDETLQVISDSTSSESAALSWSDLTGAPDWLSDPEGKIRSVIVSTVGKWVISAALTVGSWLLWALYTPFEILLWLRKVVFDALGNALAPVGTDVTTSVESIVYGLLDSTGAGVLAPLVTWVVYLTLFVATLWVVEYALKLVLRYLGLI
jgi:hypothetical protein